MSKKNLLLKQIRFAYAQKDSVFALNINEFNLLRGQITFLHGGSGCGKTTLLNLISGVIDSDLTTQLNAVFPSVAYVMHESTLLPWLSIEQCILTEEKLRKYSCDFSLFKELCEKFGLIDILSKNAARLSLGMRQRVEIAKALAFKPDLLLLDEAFSGIDAKTKHIVLKETYKLIDEFQICTIATAHQIGDLLRLAQRISWLEGGTIKQEIGIREKLEDRLEMSVNDIYKLEAAKIVLQ